VAIHFFAIQFFSCSCRSVIALHTIMVKGDGSWDLGRIHARGVIPTMWRTLMVGKIETACPVETPETHLKQARLPGATAQNSPCCGCFYQDSNEGNARPSFGRGVSSGASSFAQKILIDFSTIVFQDASLFLYSRRNYARKHISEIRKTALSRAPPPEKREDRIFEES